MNLYRRWQLSLTRNIDDAGPVLAMNNWERWVWSETLKGIAIILLPFIVFLIIFLIATHD